MKKGLILVAVLSLTLGLAQVGLAYSVNSIVHGEKQLLADGDMEKSGTGSWTAYNAVPSKQTTSPHGGKQVIRVAFDGVDAWGDAGQPVLTVGKTYRTTGWARGDGSSAPGVIPGGSGAKWSGTNSASWQRIDFTDVCAGNTTLALFSANLSATHYVEFDDVTVTEYPGKIQNKEKNLLADGNMEASGTGSWLQDISTLSKETTSPHGGKQVLRITYSVSGNGFAEQNILPIGKTYRATGWARGDGQGVPSFRTGSTTQWTGTNSTTWQRFDVTFIQSGDMWIYLKGVFNAGHYVEFDDVYVTEYVGKVQNSEKQLLADGDMEKATTAAWIDFYTVSTKSTASPHGAKQAIRINYDGSHNIALIYQNNLTANKTYRVTGWARGDGTAIPWIAQCDSTTIDTSLTASTAWQRFDKTFVAKNCTGSAYVGFRSDTMATNRWVEFDDVRITQIGP